MSNDVLWLRCEECNEAIYLAKTMCNGWYRSTSDAGDESGRDLGRSFYSFMDKHLWCGESSMARLSSSVHLLHDDEIDTVSTDIVTLEDLESKSTKA